MSGLETSDQYRLSKNRLETLFDAIFAFAMTLLVTGFVIEPISESDAPVLLPGYIAAMGMEFFLFLISVLCARIILVGSPPPVSLCQDR